MKRWNNPTGTSFDGSASVADIVAALYRARGLATSAEITAFSMPAHPSTLTPDEVGIDPAQLDAAVQRIKRAISDGESVVVYADYDADGITAGSVMWEALHSLGMRVMPYIPHRVEEGYGLSQKGIDSVREEFGASLIITVDHGITAREKVEYARTLGIDVIVTDHHVKPETVPDCITVHTTKMAGAGVSWFVAKTLLSGNTALVDDLLVLAAIGTIADMVPLVGANRAIAKYGLARLGSTKRMGIRALLAESGIAKEVYGTYDVSHVLAPRLNAMGRLEHALDALRLLCTTNEDRAIMLASKLGLTNKERQQLTVDTTAHALAKVGKPEGKIIIVSDGSYNQGVIGLVAGKLVEEYYRPAIVLTQCDGYAKASARSIPGFNIIEAIRSCSDLLVDAGGHPMAAGFTVETKNLEPLTQRLRELADKTIDETMMVKSLTIDAEVPLSVAREDLWTAVRSFEPFGLGNYEPVFATTGVTVSDARMIGNGNRHLKLKVSSGDSRSIDCIAFGMGDVYPNLKPDRPVDIAYTVDMNEWNGRRSVQLKIRDIRY